MKIVERDPHFFNLIDVSSAELKLIKKGLQLLNKKSKNEDISTIIKSIEMDVFEDSIDDSNQLSFL